MDQSTRGHGAEQGAQGLGLRRPLAAQGQSRWQSIAGGQGEACSVGHRLTRVVRDEGGGAVFVHGGLGKEQALVPARHAGI
jgi:hypothetical protein